jgi:crotonobetainyl-CoA:carnitine CoA-transferase CaiB-like acyl-CoA transferase
MTITKGKGICLAMGALVLLTGVIAALWHRTGSEQPSLVVTGTVKDAVTGRPIAGATVSDNGYGPKPYQSGGTDAAGRYRYVTWQEEHLIVAKATGYRARQQTLTSSLFRSEKEKVLEFALVPE